MGDQIVTHDVPVSVWEGDGYVMGSVQALTLSTFWMLTTTPHNVDEGGVVSPSTFMWLF
jgi:hypothetical protein